VFERIATGAALSDVLYALTKSCEEVTPGVRCSVLLLDPTTQCLHHGAAPSLPEFYCKAIDGLQIGPTQGSCGTAAFSRTRVIVEDVLRHPFWAGYTNLAMAADIRACWSEPILSSTGNVLGTFAMYYADVRSPDAFDLDFIQTSAHVAGVAIERARTEQELDEHRHNLEELVQARTLELERVNQELREAMQDLKVLRGMLPICASCKSVRDDTGYWLQIESYIAQHTEAVVTHGLCPVCADKVFPATRRR
jgi:GAF domain-containing protein